MANEKALERLARIRSGADPTPPMWETMPVRLVSVDPPRIVMESRADGRHVNTLGTVHGGFAATVLDTALGLCVYTGIGSEDRHTTVDLAVKLVRAIPLDEALAVETELVHLSRTVGVAQGVIRGPDGAVYAHGTTTCYVKRAPAG